MIIVSIAVVAVASLYGALWIANSIAARRGRRNPWIR